MPNPDEDNVVLFPPFDGDDESSDESSDDSDDSGPDLAA